MAEEEFWAGEMGRTWAGRAEALDRQLAPAGEAGLAALATRPGEHVLDLGCGAGASTAEIAGAVGPEGRVVGVDISADLLAIARARRENAGVEFIEGDAARLPLGEAVFDAMFSRFGCMFFGDPPAAYAHLRTSLKPGARVVLVAWREIAMNPWAAVPVAVGAETLGPAEPPAPGALPGPTRRSSGRSSRAPASPGSRGGRSASRSESARPVRAIRSAGPCSS